MKKIVLILSIVLCFAQANATNYYLSSSSGNDILNSGKSANSAWQSMTKLKTVLSSLLPGDSVLFKCNDTFFGQLIPSKSGNASKYIYFGSYGSGKKPMISGTATVSNWTQTKTNIWEATCADCGTKVRNFFINGIPQQLGRWPNVNEPNKGYLSYESHTGTNQITDNQLTSTIDWTGAEAVVRRLRWMLDRLTIKSHTANTLLFTSSYEYEFLDGFGYFIQNDPRTLDQQGEWYFNSINKKFSLYSEFDPNTFNTQATQLDNLIRLNGLSYVTVENFRFSGSGALTMDIINCKKLTVRNNEIYYSGENAVNLNNSNNVIFELNQINHTNNDAIHQTGCKNFVMRNNVIKNTGTIAGMGLSGVGQYHAVILGGTNLLVENNKIDSIGYIGMNFNGDTIVIRNNFLSNYCMTIDDGGGIYTWGTGTENYSRKLTGNILINAVGAPEGAVGKVAAEGIYIDDRSANVDIIGNSIYNCGNNGIFIHNGNHINIKRNTIFNNNIQLKMSHDNIAPTYPITDCVVDSNIMVSKEASQLVALYETIDNGISKIGTFDDNYYCRPLDDKLTINIGYVNGTSVFEAKALEDWSIKYQNDQHSGKSPINVEAYKVVGEKSSNYFKNSTFESNVSNWSSWANYNNSRITMVKGEGIPGSAMKARFSIASGKPDGYMDVSSNQIAPEAGKSYRLKFSARSSIDGVTLKVIPRKNGDPYNTVADVRSFVLSTSYKQFEFILYPFLTEQNTRIDFHITEGQGDIWFDNMELEEVDVENTNADDYIRFEYNATQNDKTISIPEDYVDVKGNPVSGTMILKPFTSVILFNKLSTVIGLQTEATKSDIRLIPNPVSNWLTIQSKEDIVSVCLHDMNGQVVKSFLGIGTNVYTIYDLPKSGLYIVEIHTKSSREFKKLLVQN